jgi:chromosome segregation ATPase
MANISKMRADLKDLEESLDELPEEFKDDIREEIKILKEEIAIAEKEESAKDKMKQEAEKKIEKLEKVVESPKTEPKVKEQVKKSIASVKKQVKEAVKEDEKERKAKYEARAKKKVSAVKSGAKRGRPKKAAKAVKKVVKKRVSKAEIKYTKALKSLNALVNKTAELKAKYKGQGVDLEKDASRKAKPFGYRLKGNKYRRPTKAEIKRGDAYWEGRPNRADVKPSAYPKLAAGGMMEKGGEFKKGDMVYIISYNASKPNFFAEIVEVGEKVSKVENEKGQVVKVTNDQIQKQMAKGGRTRKRSKAEIAADKRLKAKKPGRRIAESGEVYYESRENRSDMNRKLRLEDGGMMKRGGRTKAEIVADKRYKALKAGKRVSASGEVYYESRPNRSDVSRRDRI